MLKLSFQCFGMISRGKERLKILAPGTREEKARGVIADFQRARQKVYATARRRGQNSRLREVGNGEAGKSEARKEGSMRNSVNGLKRIGILVALTLAAML